MLTSIVRCAAGLIPRSGAKAMESSTSQGSYVQARGGAGRKAEERGGKYMTLSPMARSRVQNAAIT